MLLAAWLTACHRDSPPDRPDDGPPPAHTGTSTPTGTTTPPQHSATHSAAVCEHTGLPALPTEGPFADCPTFDWLVHLRSPSDDHVTHLLPLPGGDVIVAGTFAGAPTLSTDCVRAGHALGPLNVFVERLRPDGTQVWGHTLTGGYDSKMGDVVLTDSGDLWVVGAYNHGPLEVDGVVVGGFEGDLDHLFAARFASADGSVQRSLFVDGTLSVQGWGIAEQADGTVFVLGRSAELVLRVGGFSLPRANEDLVQDAFVAAYDPTGTVRWLTTLSLRSEDYAPTVPVVGPHTLTLVGSKLLVNTRLFPDGHHTLVRTATGEQASFDYGGTDDTLVPLDPATGRAEANATRMSFSLFHGVAATPAGGRLVGNTGGTWTDTAGVDHTIVGFAGTINPFLADIDELGGIVALRQLDEGGRNPVCCLEDVDVRPDGSLWAAVSSNRDATLGAGTSREWAPPDRTDSVVEWYGSDDTFRCGVGFTGGYNRVAAVAVDALGGVWMGGEFEDELNVETPAGRAAHVKGEEPLVYDGFLVRFAPAPPPE